ncbi:MAG: FAD-dependent monooxygenase [Microbacterium sp.]|uniref:FAD-dependent monooxygenase n=1 Tax=Microbacterium sp. TaxID=51671 RepID=UPI001AC646C3|nr:FAD-dependent monooxygenase [Microbacterium sp.]MBN9153474.1 FAD-dependent monooxygenase [Microbacterium sp.]
MQKLRILIIGAGVAGAAAGAFLGRSGHDVTVVERDAGVRSSGNPVDVRGEGLWSIRALGVEHLLRQRDTGSRTLAILRADGSVLTTIGVRAHDEDLEVARDDLVEVVTMRAAEVAMFRRGLTFSRLVSHDAGVDVLFTDGAQERFDLVVGADGHRSAVRSTVWGDRVRSRPIGLSIATLPLRMAIPDPRIIEMYNEPGRSLTLHPAGGRPGVAFIFRPDRPQVGESSPAERLRRRYAGVKWRGDEFLTALDHADDFYHDDVEHISTPSWSHGHVVLLGDAASSVTILGNGSSLALAGAQRLDAALRDGSDTRAALIRYERAHRPAVERNQKGAGFGAAFLVPRTRGGLWARNVAARVMRRV